MKNREKDDEWEKLDEKDALTVIAPKIPDCVVAAIMLAIDAQEIPELKTQAKAVEALLLDYYWPKEKEND